MMDMKPKLENPLDALFGTAPTEIVEYDQVTEGALAELEQAHPVEKDSEDIEIDRKIDEVYTAAIDTFNNQMQYAEMIEPRYAARNAEVAANYLNIALNAASTRARTKSDRKKSAAFVPYTGNKTNGVVVASREDIMKMIAVDAEVKGYK